MYLNRPARLRLVALLGLLFWAGLPYTSQTGSGSSVSAAASDPTLQDPTRYVPGEVLVGWQAGAGVIPYVARPKGLAPDLLSPDRQHAAQVLSERTGLAVLDSQPEYGTARLAVPVGQEAAEIARVTQLPWVKWAEPNYIAEAAGYPNDPDIGKQWNLRRIGAPAAWDVTMGSYSLRVAVVDSGVDLNHPDLAGRLDPGWNFVNPGAPPLDDCGHGTHVAGIVAATADNGIGVAGVAPNVKVLPLKVLSWNTAMIACTGTYADIATAIRRATSTGVQVINLSLGGVETSADIYFAVDDATRAGVLVVAAAGNCAQGGSGCGSAPNLPFYPAAYAQTLSVGATDHFDNWAEYSGHKSYVGLAAPGGTMLDPIWSTLQNNNYGPMAGTSMSAPLVSGAAALVWTFLPTATGNQIAEILKATADKIGPYPYPGSRNDYFGYGRLNVERAVRWAYPPKLELDAVQQNFLLGAPVFQQTVKLRLNNSSGQAALWRATVVQGVDWLTAFPGTGSATYTSPGVLNLRAGPTLLAPGVYNGMVHVESLYPSGTGFDIPVRLRTAPSLKRSFEPVTVSQYEPVAWVDPLSGGQPLHLSNDTASQIPLPFPVQFYGQAYNNLWVSDNGLASFSPPVGGQVSGSSTCLPTAAAPNNAIYALWKDWNPALGGEVYVQQPDDNRYVVTWYQVVSADSPTPQSFQLVIIRDGPLWFHYQTTTPLVQGTIGIEYYDGTVATQVACDGAGRAVGNGDLFSLQPDLPW